MIKAKNYFKIHHYYTNQLLKIKKMEEDKFAYKSEVLFFNLSNCVSHSVVSDFVTSWTVACQAPPSMGFSRQEYWSGLGRRGGVKFRTHFGDRDNWIQQKI